MFNLSLTCMALKVSQAKSRCSLLQQTHASLVALAACGRLTDSSAANIGTWATALKLAPLIENCFTLLSLIMSTPYSGSLQSEAIFFINSTKFAKSGYLSFSRLLFNALCCHLWRINSGHLFKMSLIVRWLSISLVMDILDKAEKALEISSANCCTSAALDTDLPDRKREVIRSDIKWLSPKRAFKILRACW